MRKEIFCFISVPWVFFFADGQIKPVVRSIYSAGKVQIVSNIHMSKRIRFGLIFAGPPPANNGGFLRSLGIKHIEGCDMGEKRYVLFTLDKARKPTDVLHAVEEHNKEFPSSELDEELLMASDGMLTSGSSAMILMPCCGVEGSVDQNGTSTKAKQKSQPSKVAVFDKGHAFQSHEIFRTIHTAKLALVHVEAPSVPGDLFVPLLSSEIICDRPTGYWSWGSLDDLPSTSQKRRAINALSTDLVEEAIKPSASKRVSPTLYAIDQPEALVPVDDTIRVPFEEEGVNSSDDAVIAEQQVCVLNGLCCYSFHL